MLNQVLQQKYNQQVISEASPKGLVVNGNDNKNEFNNMEKKLKNTQKRLDVY